MLPIWNQIYRIDKCGMLLAARGIQLTIVQGDGTWKQDRNSKESVDKHRKWCRVIHTTGGRGAHEGRMTSCMCTCKSVDEKGGRDCETHPSRSSLLLQALPTFSNSLKNVMKALVSQKYRKRAHPSSNSAPCNINGRDPNTCSKCHATIPSSFR